MKTNARVAAVKADIRGIFAKALAQSLPCLRLIEVTSARVRNLDPPLPEWARMELRGYIDANFEWHEVLFTQDRWELDGVLFGRGQARDAAFEGRWSEVKYAGRWYVDESGRATALYHARVQPPK